MCIRDRYQRRVHGDIIWGTAQVMIEFVAEWTRQPSRKVGYLNLRGKRLEVLSESLQVKSSFLLTARFNNFINEIIDFVIRPRFETSPLFFDKGIPIQDTPANYTNTEVYWGEDFDVILLTPVSYTHLRAHETSLHLVCRLLLEKKKKTTKQ
eukprot:TRINITY_DN5982_c0_g1_i3.p1 TRINITY_DN5982_c0_g1~~TRINITY_DN5982_c0_g1_i3.p1  ORF type:complete len:152 (+),score=44.24 TRINITY_DN5982_c0_g1_i3:146-601(+)